VLLADFLHKERNSSNMQDKEKNSCLGGKKRKEKDKSYTFLILFLLD